MELISTTALTGGISTVTLSAIPQTFESLILWGEGITTASGGNLNLRVNGVTSSNYLKAAFNGDNVTTGAGTDSMFRVVQIQTGVANLNTTFVNYTGGSPKIILNNSVGGGSVIADTAVYNNIFYINEAAINSITVIQHANWTAGTLLLYGVK